MKAARLALQSGRPYEGQLSRWTQGDVFGEVVFNTGMVGYVEAMTDPSYRHPGLPIPTRNLNSSVRPDFLNPKCLYDTGNCFVSNHIDGKQSP